MNLKKAVKPAAVTLDLQGDTKDAVIEELIDLLVAAGSITDRDAACTAVKNRESKMSTGMQDGIAIPHGKSETVATLVAAVGIHRRGIDFDAIDKQPCTIFILTISPTNRTGPHIQFLAEISRLLNNASVRQQLLEADTPESMIEILTG